MLDIAAKCIPRNIFVLTRARHVLKAFSARNDLLRSPIAATEHADNAGRSKAEEY